MLQKRILGRRLQELKAGLEAAIDGYKPTLVHFNDENELDEIILQSPPDMPKKSTSRKETFLDVIKEAKKDAKDLLSGKMTLLDLTEKIMAKIDAVGLNSTYENSATSSEMDLVVCLVRQIIDFQ